MDQHLLRLKGTARKKNSSYLLKKDRSKIPGDAEHETACVSLRKNGVRKEVGYRLCMCTVNVKT